MIRHIIAALFILLTLSSCIGKIEDANLEAAQNADAGSSFVEFGGLTRVTPISNDKVELYFFPAPGPTSELTYLIRVNNSVVPIEVKADSLQLTDEGTYRFTATGLSVNTTYTFAVGVRDGRDGSQSNNDTVLTTDTFANYTANFNGISSVAPVVGVAGQNSVLIKWVPAETLGSVFSSKPNDPVAYEVSYLASSDGSISDLMNGTNPSIVKLQNPTVLSASPSGSTERERTITGLIPDTLYYFRVRAVHKSWVDFGHLTGYKKEQNNKILSVRTLAAGGVFDWSVSSFINLVPSGEAGLTKMDFSWSSAVGPFTGYRLYNIKVGLATENLIDVEAAAPSLDSVLIDSLNGTSTYTSFGAADLSARLSNLDSYGYYKSVLVACRTVTCGDGERIIGNPILYRVIPNLASFSGILNIEDPQVIADKNKVILEFDPPVIENGFINDFEIYCYENLADNSPELLTSVASSSGKPGCNGLKRNTATPVVLADYKNLNQVEIETELVPGSSGASFFPDGDASADREYCFAAVPVINGTNYTNKDLSNAIIRCSTPIVKVPTIDQFAGVLSNSCISGADSLTADWVAPTGGLYDKYVLYYKENDGSIFKFTDALAGDAAYTRIDDLTALTYQITGLTPGKKYQYGVLTYIDETVPIYSELNIGIGDCEVPIPSPRFNEWIDVMAIGPKGDGRRTPSSVTRDKVYLAETLNNSGQPMEVEVDVSDRPTTNFENQFGTLGGSSQFNGIYNSSLTQNSKSGVVRIAWKDVDFNAGTITMEQLISLYDPAGPKKDRGVGYRVYRSDDNQVSWKDLTDGGNPFQSISNEGLLHSDDYTEKARSNASDETFKAVMFTDYSVQSVKNFQGKNRARVYFYKVVPVFLGNELEYEREDTNPQHIIKVTLPPENMALVHRLIANRQTCLELGKTYVADVSTHYTCDWTGVGSRGLGTPWIAGTTIYDFGPDMLIDRNELGCNYTRGDYSNENSEFTPDGFDFLGLSSGGSNFVGCLNKNGEAGVKNDGPSAPAPGNSYTDYKQYRNGDCIGAELSSMFLSDSICADPAKTRMMSFISPGIRSSAAFANCNNSQLISGAYFDSYGDNTTYMGDAVQSEFAAVYYNRTTTNSDYTMINHGYYRGAGATADRDGLNLRIKEKRAPSRCLINIPVKDERPIAEGTNRLKPRWIPSNRLDQLEHNSVDLNLFNMSMNDLLVNNALFDGSANKVPDASFISLATNPRFEGETKIAQIFSSNDAKLPPLTGFSQEQANEVCGAYTVQVGTYNDDDSTFSQIGDDRQKRLMRRTEGIVASAYPKEFDDTKILSLEDGSYNQAAVTSGTTFNPSCNSYDRDVEDGAEKNNLRRGEEFNTRMPSSDQGTAPSPVRPQFTTGSSFYDSSNSIDYNSQSCTSRYGVQDIIGNVGELSTEQIYCDFSGEQLMLGGGTSANSVSVGSGARYLNSLTAWVQSDPNTGRCSFVEAGSLRTSTFSTSGAHIPLYDIFGNLNTSMVSASNTIDPRSVAYLRSSDGFFLDFGQSNFAPPISKNDTLALNENSVVQSRSLDNSDPRQGIYFNPVVGMPLDCNGTTCISTPDNKSITTDSFVTKHSLTPGDFTVPDFPVGMSEIYSDGMSEITRSTGWYRSPDTYSYTYDYIEAVTGSPLASELYSANNGGALKSSLDNDGIEIDAVWWKVERSHPLTFQNFGRTREQGGGRYSAHIVGRSPYQVSKDLNIGFRCAIRLGDIDE